MNRIPEPDRTPDGPAYEGRLLDRPDEEVVDQGAAFDLRTLLTRRGMLGLAGLGVSAIVLAACTPSVTASGSPSPSATTTPTPTASPDAAPADVAEIPEETAGPYPGDGSNGPDILADSGIVRQDIRSSIDGAATADGVPLVFELQIVDLAGGVPAKGAAVYAWHCNAQGEYSLYSSGLEDVTYLRGVQVADASGMVSFTSVFPGCYAGRWPHIHFEVFPDVSSITDAKNAIATSQLALPEAASAAVYATSGYDGSSRNLSRITLASDNVFGEDSAASQLATMSGEASSGYRATLVVGVNS